jgi:F0F1-type ATP synthase assembly protein I
MNWSALEASLKQVWDSKPGLIVLLLIGFLVFILIVMDVWRHKKQQRKERPHGKKRY